jgi:hypothetical protein
VEKPFGEVEKSGCFRGRMGVEEWLKHSSNFPQYKLKIYCQIGVKGRCYNLKFTDFFVLLVLNNDN